MQRLTRSAPIDNSTLATYEETVAIIHRHLPPSLALLYATARRSAEGNLEWWTERQGLATPQSALSDTEQLKIQSKRQLYQDTVAGLIEQLKARGDAKSAQALQTLLTHSQELTCYSVGGEPVLINWAIPVQESPATVAVAPWQRRFLPWLLLLLLLLLALAWWWFTCHNRPVAVLPVQSETPSAMTNTSPKNTQLTQDNPSINLEKERTSGELRSI
ncbi:hypothetical protein FORC065_3475 [Yersinia enterocolitica]|nr:hypothetical protein FORC065_3475 [Yersinia enterocolitica]